jgi:hypothetical protein
LATRGAKRTIDAVEEPESKVIERDSGARARNLHPERTCPNCGAPLLEQKCKLLCPNRECGYYMSCSDFY